MAYVENYFAESGGLYARPKKAVSPFYSRAYGGFTEAQKQFYLSQLGDVRGKTILDPMAGQGFLLAQLAYQGAAVWLGDINPALCLIASLRSPNVLGRHDRLAPWLTRVLTELKPVQDWPSLPLEYVETWVPKNIREELHQYRSRLKLEANPFHERVAFWRQSLRNQFAATLPILAARDLACFRSSDNQTWVKPGGLQREQHIFGPILKALADWTEYARATSTSLTDNVGELIVRRMDAERGNFSSAPRADAIVTSPPYANRLDYTRMWGPESEIAAAMWDAGTNEIQGRQIGSNVVRGVAIDGNDEARLPPAVLKALRAIREDSASYASKGYYYPFFRNYAVALARCFNNLASQVKQRGQIIVFVRDTVRKDIMFPTAILVEKTLTRHGFRIQARERRIIKQHVGLRRRDSVDGLYGIAQQEWWLSFRRGGA